MQDNNSNDMQRTVQIFIFFCVCVKWDTDFFFTRYIRFLLQERAARNLITQQPDSPTSPTSPHQAEDEEGVYDVAESVAPRDEPVRPRHTQPKIGVAVLPLPKRQAESSDEEEEPQDLYEVWTVVIVIITESKLSV